MGLRSMTRRDKSHWANIEVMGYYFRETESDRIQYFFEDPPSGISGEDATLNPDCQTVGSGNWDATIHDAMVLARFAREILIEHGHYDSVKKFDDWFEKRWRGLCYAHGDPGEPIFNKIYEVVTEAMPEKKFSGDGIALD